MKRFDLYLYRTLVLNFWPLSSGFRGVYELMGSNVVLNRKGHCCIIEVLIVANAVSHARFLVFFFIWSLLLDLLFIFDWNRTGAKSSVSFPRYNAVIQSWQLAFNWEHGVNFQVREVRARVLTEMAWVTMKTFVDVDSGPFNVTNIYEFHNGRWYMVHHHSSVMLIDGDVEEQILHA